jgi:hypothetical protein
MSLSIATVERRFTSFDVYDADDILIDTVFHTGCTVEEQKRSLIDHDDYSPDIEVYGVAETVLPLTKKEMRALLEDVDVRVQQDIVSWHWYDETGASLPFPTEEAALRDAVESLELDTKGVEDTWQ